MSPADRIVAAALGLALLVLAVHAVRLAYRRANPRRLPGPFTTVEQGRKG